MMRTVVPGATSVSVYFCALDGTTGRAYTGLTTATAGLAISYQLTPTGTVTAISLSDLAAANSAYSSGGIKHVAGGVYRLCLPDAAIPASEGATCVVAGTATDYDILGSALVGRTTPASVANVAAVETDTQDIQSRLPAALVSGRIDASVGAMAAGTVTAAAIATDAIDADALAADAVTEVQSGLATAASIAALNNLSSAQAQTAAAAALTAYDPPTHAELTNELATADDATLAAIAALPTVSAIWSGITATAGNFIADHVLRRSWATAAASADGDAKSFRSLLGAVAKLVNRFAIVATTATVYEADDTTALGTQTATTDADAEHVTGLNTD